MPVQLALLKTVVELVASDAVVRGARAAWAQLPWAKDGRKAERAEKRTAALAEDVATLARTLPVADVEAGMERALARFETDLTGDGLKPDEARTIRDAVKAQLKASVLGPVVEIRRLGERIEDLGTERATLTKRIEELERRAEEDRRRSATTFPLALAALVLAAIAVGVVLAGLAIRR